MEIIFDNVRKYILALQEVGSFTAEDIATMSGVALGTVKNIISGKTEKNPGIVTILKIITALGGNLNDAVGYEKKKEIEVNSMISLKESYEIRISDITKESEDRIADIKEMCDIRVADIIKSCDTRVEDVLKCCEARVADVRKFYEDLIKNGNNNYPLQAGGFTK